MPAKLRELYSRPLGLLGMLISSCLVFGLAMLGASPASVEEDAPSTVDVVLGLDTGKPEQQPEGRLLLQPLLGGADVHEVALGGDAAPAVTLPAHSSWEIVTDVPDWWAPRRVITTGAAGSRTVATLRVWPTGDVQGRVSVAGEGEWVAALEAVITAPPDTRPGDRLPAGSVQCPVDDQGHWRCALPAARLDVSFRMGGFVPHYRWDLEVRADKPTDIGTLRLEQGASLVGWVRVEDGELDPKRCVARLLPLQAPGRDPRVAERLNKALHEATVNDRGFFQLTGLHGGSFLLEIAQPGYAPARLFPLELWRGSESRIEDELVLRKALTLEVLVSPPVDSEGRPWGVQVYRHADYSASLDHEPAFQGPVDASGRVLVPDQAPGTFWFMVRDMDGNDVASEWRVPIRGEEDALQVIDVAQIHVEGTLSLGEEPLAATVFFGGRYADVSVRMEADEEGRFTGVLPRDGAWRIEVEAEEPKLRERTRTEVRANQQREARVEIALPDTEVFGVVVDGQDAPVVGADVGLSDNEGGREIRTDERGEFRFRGVPAGPARLSAAHERGSDKQTAQPVNTTISEGVPSGPFELRLIETKPFRARVVSPRGNIAGAVVSVIPTPGWRYPVDGTTGLDGRLELRVPSNAQTLDVLIRAPGQALQALRVSADEAAVLPVTDHGGTIELEMVSVRRPILFQDGVAVPLGAVINWAWSHGGEVSETVLRAPNVAPGHYRLCQQLNPLAATISDTAPDDGCSSVHLGVGETARIDAPGKSARHDSESP